MTPRRDLSNFQFGLGLLGVYLAWLVIAYFLVELLTNCPPTLFPKSYECRGDPLATTFLFMIVPGLVLGSLFAIAVSFHASANRLRKVHSIKCDISREADLSL